MYYIQNFRHVEDPMKQRPGSLAPWLKAEYMGASEFEWGVIPMAWRFLDIVEDVRIYTHEVQSIGGKEAKVTFYAITTLEGFEFFKNKIDFHMDGVKIGERAKRWTGLWEKFNTDHQPVFDGYPDAWMALGGLMNAALNHYTDDQLKDIGKDKYRSLGSEAEPIFFTADANLAKRVFLQLKRGRLCFDANDFRIGDQVLTYKFDQAMKVCGLNENGTISCKIPHGKPIKFQATDVFPYEQATALLQGA